MYCDGAVSKLLTCVPNILDPDVGAGCKEQPMNRDEQKANHVGRDGNANEEYWECLKDRDGKAGENHLG